MFDIVFSNAALHWIADHRPVLRGISRALKAGGRALLQMGGRGNAADVLAIVNAVIRQPAWQSYFTDFTFSQGFYGPEDYQPWLHSAGLSARHVELIPKDMTHGSVDAFAGWLRTTWVPWIHAVPEDRRTAFIDELVASYVRDSAGRTGAGARQNGAPGGRCGEKSVRRRRPRNDLPQMLRL